MRQDIDWLGGFMTAGRFEHDTAEFEGDLQRGGARLIGAEKYTTEPRIFG